MAPPPARYFFSSVAVECKSDDASEAAKASNSLWERLQKISGAAFDPPLHRFHVPAVLPGSNIDSLLTLTDEIPQLNRILEDLSQKVSGMIDDLEDNKGSKAGYLTVQGVALDAFVSSFLWDSEMYPLTSSPMSIFETIKDEISKVQQEMVAVSQRFHDIRNKLRLMQKGQLGSLTVRDLSLVVKPDDLIFSEFLTTLLVVMPNNSQEEWLLSYEFIDADFVVARSSQLLYQDENESLYSVTMFSHVTEKFTANAEAKGFVVRAEYSPEVLIAKQKEWEMIQCERQDMVQLLYNRNSQVVYRLIHLSALRIYIESYLRYGPNFLSFTCSSTPRSQSSLKQMFEDLAGNSDFGRDPFSFLIKISGSRSA